jgi:hypothetical protein
VGGGSELDEWGDIILWKGRVVGVKMAGDCGNVDYKSFCCQPAFDGAISIMSWKERVGHRGQQYSIAMEISALAQLMVFMFCHFHTRNHCTLQAAESPLKILINAMLMPPLIRHHEPPCTIVPLIRHGQSSQVCLDPASRQFHQ